MTRDKLMQAFGMRMDGMSYEDIAEALGESRQNVQQCLYGVLVTQVGKKAYKRKVISVYPAIADWCEQHNVNMRGLSLMTDINYHKLRNSLQGRRQFRAVEMARIIDVTGLGYDQAFAQ